MCAKNQHKNTDFNQDVTMVGLAIERSDDMICLASTSLRRRARDVLHFDIDLDS
jgi:hypothetical protein